MLPHRAPSAVSFGASKEPRKGQRKERQIAGAASFGAYKEAVRGSTNWTVTDGVQALIGIS